MNAQLRELQTQDVAFEQPEIRDLLGKLKRAEKALPGFESAQKKAEAKRSAAESERDANTDPAQDPALRQALLKAQGGLADADGSLRVAQQNIVRLHAEIDSRVAHFHRTEFQRSLANYRVAKTESRKRRLAAERADIEIDHRFLAELSLHKPDYPNSIDHGNPQIHVGNGYDIIRRRLIPDCSIGENKTFFEWLKT